MVITEWYWDRFKIITILNMPTGQQNLKINMERCARL